MMRVRSQKFGADGSNPTPFDEVLRRLSQAQTRFEEAVEVEELQTVGMSLRECLLSLAFSLRRHLDIEPETEAPQAANFSAWSDLIANELCPGRGNKEMRSHVKDLARSTWQLVNWLTHTRSASHASTAIAVDSVETLVSTFVRLMTSKRTEDVEVCPNCKSREILSHYDMAIEPDGDYFLVCGSCGWHTHPTN